MKAVCKIAISVLLSVVATTVVADSVEITDRGAIPFAAYDSDGNGIISEQEFYAVRAKRMAARAEEGRPMRNAANAPAFSEFDSDGDGGLTPDELAAGQQSRMQQHGGMGGAGQGAGMGQHMPSFEEFDLDGDGVLVKDEFIEARGQRISERVKQGYQMRGLSNMMQFEDIDVDANGKATPEEFAAAQEKHRQSMQQQ
jgi:Ca2+-binding EF-hand superfamily protein